jgi:aminoglycoside phosphotransferase (APT) family kinase protein
VSPISPIDPLAEHELGRDPAGWAGRLLAAHGLGGAPLEPMRGWSNAIWASEAHVVRISSGRFEQSLSHEAAVFAVLPQAPCPRVVAIGRVGRREWMIQTRMPGAPLMQCWPNLTWAERELAVRSLAQAVRVVHATPFGSALREPPWRAAALRPGGDLSVALRVHPLHYRRLLEANRERRTAPAALLDRAGAFIAQRLDSFAADNDVLVHGDIAFGNVIWDGAVVRLVDFEAAGAAPPDRELDVLLRFLDAPETFSPEAGSRALYEPVIGWLRDAYPEVLAHPALVERLEVYDALWELVQLMNFPADHPRRTVARLEAILSGRAGWKDLIES